MQPDELKALRAGLGWTQQQMADGLGMSRKAIVEMEGGKAPIEKRTALAARYLAAKPRLEAMDQLKEAVDKIPAAAQAGGALIAEAFKKSR